MQSFHYWCANVFPDDRDIIRFVGMGFEKPNVGFARQATHAEMYTLLFFHGEVPQLADAHTGFAAYLAKPGSVVEKGEADKSWRQSWLQINGSFVEEQISKHQIPLNTFLPMPDDRTISLHQYGLYRELQEFAPPRVAMALHWIEGMFQEISSSREGMSFSRPVPERLREVRSYIQQNYTQPITLDELADIAGCSSQWLCQTFRSFYQATPIMLMTQLRLADAAHLLRSTDLRVGEIADQTGYHDIYNFSKIFKRHYHQSPTQYRNHHAE